MLFAVQVFGFEGGRPYLEKMQPDNRSTESCSRSPSFREPEFNLESYSEQLQLLSSSSRRQEKSDSKKNREEKSKPIKKLPRFEVAKEKDFQQSEEENEESEARGLDEEEEEEDEAKKKPSKKGGRPKKKRSDSEGPERTRKPSRKDDDDEDEDDQNQPKARPAALENIRLLSFSRCFHFLPGPENWQRTKPSWEDQRSKQKKERRWQEEEAQVKQTR